MCPLTKCSKAIEDEIPLYGLLEQIGIIVVRNDGLTDGYDGFTDK